MLKPLIIDMSEKSVQEIAQLFREAFLFVDLSGAFGNLPYFPKGCCSWATWFLGHYLKFENGLEPVEIQGTRLSRDGMQNHAWLEVSGLTVDITSDQFEDCASPIYGVVNSLWHQTWKRVHQVDIFEVERLDRANIKPSEIYKRIHTQVRARGDDARVRGDFPSPV